MADTNSKPKNLGLYCILLGCTPNGRNIEQHDVFFGLAERLEDLTNDMKAFWHKTNIDELVKAVTNQSSLIDVDALKKKLHDSLTRRDKVHIDAWTKIEHADGYKINIQTKALVTPDGGHKLYFINLGGYRENEFEEYHKKLFVVAHNVSEAVEKIKQDDFMKMYSPQSLGRRASAHLDDKHKIDLAADDIICISDVLDDDYVLTLEKVETHAPNEMAVGYVKLNYAD